MLILTFLGGECTVRKEKAGPDHSQLRIGLVSTAEL